MNAILWPFFNFVAKNRWAQIVLGLGIFWLIFMVYLAMRDSGVRRIERERIKAAQAEVRARVNQRSTEIITEERQHADEAIRARDTSPLYPTPDVMPDDLRRVTFGDKRGS